MASLFIGMTSETNKQFPKLNEVDCFQLFRISKVCVNEDWPSNISSLTL